jgi:ribosomal protein S20
MRRAIILSLALLSIVLSGCIQSNTVIRVNPDGSGVVEETVLLSPLLVASMQNLARKAPDEASADMAAGKGKEKTEDPGGGGDYIKKQIEEAKAKIEAQGSDIKFISAVPVKTETMTGYRTVYSFRDINKLSINQNPSDKTGKGDPKTDKAGKKKELLMFSFARGAVSTLTVRMPERDDKANKKDKLKTESKKTPEEEAAAAEALKMFFKDMSVKIDIEVTGAIVGTNATYRDKSRITLLDMEFGKIFENKEAFDRLSKAQPKTIEEMKTIVKDIKGLKIELNNPVVVDFR